MFKIEKIIPHHLKRQIGAICPPSIPDTQRKKGYSKRSRGVVKISTRVLMKMVKISPSYPLDYSAPLMLDGALRGYEE